MLEKVVTAEALLVVLVTMFATFSRAEETCAGGHINQHLCQKTCYFNKCTCNMVDTTSFSSCSQKCHFLSSCPAMDCSGRNACAQKCFFGDCNMKCGSSKFCSQLCAWKARCNQIMCSSPLCNQVCANCTMECTREVDKCDQMCLGGVCKMKCSAKQCRRQCFKGICDYIGESHSKASIAQGRALVFLVTLCGLFRI